MEGGFYISAAVTGTLDNAAAANADPGHCSFSDHRQSALTQTNSLIFS